MQEKVVKITKTQEIIDKAIELKKEQPRRGDDTINKFLQDQYGITIPKATLYRHLKLAGATKLKLGVMKKKVRKRWTRDRTHDLWVGDFQNGPYVLFEGEVVPTYLSLFIDAHSRYVIEGRYYLRQSLDILIDSLLRAWAVHGSSKDLYPDNAKIYHSYALKSACYGLYINLIHRTAGDPAPGGLVERFFRTSQEQFESEVRARDILTLDKLNRAFFAYLDMAYHQRIHSETKQMPKERYHQGITVIRHVNMDEAAKFFMKQEERTVDKDFSDIRLQGRFYRVDQSLRSDKVKVLCDPFSDLKKVLIYSFLDVYLGQGILYQRDRGAETRDPASSQKAKNDYLELLKKKHEKALAAESNGIDYRKAVSKSAWPFTSFTKKLTTLMGKREGLGAFNTEEYEVLRKAYNRMPQINESLLIAAFEKANTKTIPQIIWELEKLKNSQEEK